MNPIAWKLPLILVIVAFLMPALPMPAAHASDEFAVLRARWRAMLDGGPNYNPADPAIAARIAVIDSTAQGFWNTLDTAPTRTSLWADLPGTQNSDQIMSSYQRLKAMALAYRTRGSAYHNNTALRTAIIDGLEWLYANRYYIRTPYGNWYPWQIGVPLNLNEIVILLYDDLTTTQITNYMAVVDHFSPSPTMTGANRVWKATVVIGRGIIVGSAAKIASGRDGLSPVFDYVTSGDGFYRDGSFVQHTYYAYTGGYGKGLLVSLATILYLIDGSTWQVTDPDLNNVYRWIYDSFEPALYRGAFMDALRGREIARHYQEDHATGHVIIGAIIWLAQIAPAADADAFQRMIKDWITSDTFFTFSSQASIAQIELAAAIQASAGPRTPLDTYRLHAASDRAILVRPTFALSISMSSSRIANYESINGENRRGWYTGDGMTALYTADLEQFSAGFWPTVDSRRLPGTTVDSQLSRGAASGAGYRSPSHWVGGATLENRHGIAGMELDAWGSSLTARKSWFLFGDQVVALGAGISANDGRPIETIVENRRLPTGGGTLTINGTAQPSGAPWSATVNNVTWAHLAGPTPVADIGYYFPTPANLTGKREIRSGSWQDINTLYFLTNTLSNSYVSLGLPHGVNPANASYAYVLLPGRSSAATAAYAGAAPITVLANTPAVQAVSAPGLGLTGAAFWNDGVQSVALGGDPAFLTSNRKSAVVVQERPGEIALAIADPTQQNTGTIEVTLNRSAACVLTADPTVTVTQLTPQIQLSIAVNGARGGSQSVTLRTSGACAQEIIIDNPATERDGTWGTSTLTANYYGQDYAVSNAGSGADRMRWRPTITSAGTYAIYYWLSDPSASRATNAPFTVHYDGGSQLYQVNQVSAPGGQWIYLGSHPFAVGTAGYVELTDAANNWVVGDAVKFVPTTITLDNTSAGVSFSGAWSTSTKYANRQGADYRHDGNSNKGAKTVTYTPSLPSGGTYVVRMWWPGSDSQYATNVPVEIHHSGGVTTVTLNQQQNAGQWNTLGTFTFPSGATGKVVITTTGTNGFVVADAVQFIQQ